MVYLFAKFDKKSLQQVLSNEEKWSDFRPLIVALTLNVGTLLLFVTHLLIMLYLSVKFL